MRDVSMTRAHSGSGVGMDAIPARLTFVTFGSRAAPVGVITP